MKRKIPKKEHESTNVARLCQKCKHACKQEAWVVIVRCPLFEEKEGKDV